MISIIKLLFIFNIVYLETNCQIVKLFNKYHYYEFQAKDDNLKSTTSFDYLIVGEGINFINFYIKYQLVSYKVI